MALNKQTHIYSVDTSDFYNEKERAIHDRMGGLYKKRAVIKKKKIEKRTEFEKRRYKRLNKVLGKLKHRLVLELDKNKDVRELNAEFLCTSKIISTFESTLTRVLKMKNNELHNDIIIVRTYFFKVLENIIKDGFTLNGERYILLTASAGQIRLKKTVWVKESVWNKYELSLTCGLTKEIINSKGGINTNKYVAYLALQSTATDEWKGFDIDKCIVVDDFETDVSGVVDFIEEKTYEIQEKVKMDIPISHSDGTGLCLPSVSKKAKMIRAPWVKGLLIPMPFDKFIEMNKKENPDCMKVKDIYGREYDIIEDKISVIFTKSQFKMWKYYESWDDYKEKFKKHSCQVGFCNEEANHFKDAKINYQMLQTLSDMTTEELIEISSKTKHRIMNVGRDKDTMLKILGATKHNINKNYLQQALVLYPEMLQDNYCKEVVKQVKKSMVKDARSGKLSIDAKYTFIMPDVYAMCEFIFLKDKNPQGLLKDGEVSCKLFQGIEKLDVLRSPHLYLEHCIRNNIVNDDIKKWFVSSGIYTSCHDVISKMLQFDVDGDASLVCSEPTLIKVAERNSKDVVPLYYKMATSTPQPLNNDTLYNGMINAYTSGNIGMYSNNITKIWNSENIDLNVIKYLCMENNFVIDYAKTLYMPERPPHIKELISEFTKTKVPYFFKFAKDKEASQIEDKNNTGVNRLSDTKIMPNPAIKFNASNLGKFDYKMLMNNPDVEINEGIINMYSVLDLKKGFMNKNTEDVSPNSLLYKYVEIRNKLFTINTDKKYIVDVIIKHLYNSKDSKFKITLWSSFGDIIIDNINNNLKTHTMDKTKLCEVCGERVDVSNPKNTSQKYCDKCAKEEKLKYDRELIREKRKNVVKQNTL